MVVGTGGAGASWALSKASASAAPAIPLGDPALDAALRYFGTHGLHAAALDDVARSGDLDVREVSRRYPTSRCLALGLFERMLDLLGEQLEEQSRRGASLTERLQSWFELELQLLEPCKALVRSWLLDSLNPLSPTALLQGPLAIRYGSQIERQLELARDRGEISGWVLPGVAAGAFIGLRRSLFLGWLGDDSAAERTLPFARAEIAAFVRLLAPWPGLDDVRPSASRPIRVQEPRALPAPAEAAKVSAHARSLPAATVNLREEAEAEAVAPVQVEAVQAAVVQVAAQPVAVVQPAVAEATEAAPAAAVNAAVAQAPAVLGTLAQAEATPEALASLAPEAEPPSEPPAIGNGAPAPVQPGSEKSSARSKRRSRAKRSKH